MKPIFGALEEQFAILWACFLFSKLGCSQNLYISWPSCAKFVKASHIWDNGENIILMTSSKNKQFLKQVFHKMSFSSSEPQS